MREISIMIILIYRKLGSVGPVQQKIVKSCLRLNESSTKIKTKFHIHTSEMIELQNTLHEKSNQ